MPRGADVPGSHRSDSLHSAAANSASCPPTTQEDQEDEDKIWALLTKPPGDNDDDDGKTDGGGVGKGGSGGGGGGGGGVGTGGTGQGAVGELTPAQERAQARAREKLLMSALEVHAKMWCAVAATTLPSAAPPTVASPHEVRFLASKWTELAVRAEVAVTAGTPTPEVQRTASVSKGSIFGRVPPPASPSEGASSHGAGGGEDSALVRFGAVQPAAPPPTRTRLLRLPLNATVVPCLSFLAGQVSASPELSCDRQGVSGSHPARAGRLLHLSRHTCSLAIHTNAPPVRVRSRTFKAAHGTFLRNRPFPGPGACRVLVPCYVLPAAPLLLCPGSA